MRLDLGIASDFDDRSPRLLKAPIRAVKISGITPGPITSYACMPSIFTWRPALCVTDWYISVRETCCRHASLQLISPLLSYCVVTVGVLHRYVFPGLRICCDHIDAFPMLGVTMPWTLHAITATLPDTDLNTFSWQCFAADPSYYHIA